MIERVDRQFLKTIDTIQISNESKCEKLLRRIHKKKKKKVLKIHDIDSLMMTLKVIENFQLTLKLVNLFEFEKLSTVNEYCDSFFFGFKIEMG